MDTGLFFKSIDLVAKKAADLQLAIEEGVKVLRESDAMSECTVERRLADYFDLLTQRKLWPTTSAFEASSLDVSISRVRGLSSQNPHEHSCSLGQHLSHLENVATKVQLEINECHPQPSTLRFEFHEDTVVYY